MNIFEFYDKIEFKEEAEMLIHRIQKMGSDVIIGADGIINVEGDVNISGSFYRRLPVRFGKVDGDFLAHFSDLETLEGAPKEVTGLFDVTSCNLRSLEGGPNNPTRGIIAVITSLHLSKESLKLLTVILIVATISLTRWNTSRKWSMEMWLSLVTRKFGQRKK